MGRRLGTEFDFAFVIRVGYVRHRHALSAGAARGEALWLTEDDFHRPGPGGFPSMYFATRETND